MTRKERVRIPQLLAMSLALAFGVGGWTFVMRDDATVQALGWLSLFFAAFFFAVFNYQRHASAAVKGDAEPR